MANVSFYRQTTGSTATGAITFDTTNKYIYLGDGSTAHKFDCNNTYTDTKNTAGSSNTSSKIYLIGATSQATNPQTYSHDTAYVGTDGCLYSNSNKVAERKTQTLNTGTVLPISTNSSITATYTFTDGIILSASANTITNNGGKWVPGTVSMTLGTSGGSPSTKLSCSWTCKTAPTLAESPYATFTVSYIKKS